tara:strand:- start:2586 stop:3434 length:849 start_codon:yes stop_codon:yes gene_type:complete
MELKEKVFIIAEIGINHNGSIQYAKELIDLAKECGCDAVKFQKRTIEIVYKKEFLDSPRLSPWGKTQREQKEGLEFSLDQYNEIDEYCKEKSIDWFVSCWDIPSQISMRKFNTKYNKVASAMATNLEFLKVVAEEKKHTFLSTGMTNIQEIEIAVEIFDNASCPITLMHSVSTYPAQERHLNLNCIKSLQTKFEKPIGYSGHEATVLPSIVAAVLGATCIERHITLDRAMYGSDQAASLQKNGLRDLVNSVRKSAIVLGDGEKKIIPEEMEVAKKLRYWYQN